MSVLIFRSLSEVEVSASRPRSLRAVLVICMLFALQANAQTNDAPYPIDLPTTLRLAKADNLDVKLAQARINEAKANHGSAIARFLPWVSAGVAYRTHEGRIQAVDGTMLDADKESTSIGPAIAMQVDIGDALFSTLAARQTVYASESALLAQQQDSTLAAASAYFELLKAKALVEANREALITSQTYEQQLQGGVAAGVIFKADLLRVQTQTQRYQTAVIQAQQQQRLASARLAELLYLDPSIELVPQDSELVPIALLQNESTQDVLIQQALDARPELQQSQAQLQAAREAKKSAVWGPLIPTLGAQAFVGELTGGRDGDSGEYADSRDYFIGLNWRFGPGGLFDITRINSAKAKLNSAELGVEKTSNSIKRQVIEARAWVLTSSEQMIASRNALSNASETLRLTRERKQLGVGIVLEDIQAQQELVRVRTEYLNAITEYNKAQYELSKALGTL